MPLPRSRCESDGSLECLPLPALEGVELGLQRQELLGARPQTTSGHADVEAPWLEIAGDQRHCSRRAPFAEGDTRQDDASRAQDSVPSQYDRPSDDARELGRHSRIGQYFTAVVVRDGVD